MTQPIAINAKFPPKLMGPLFNKPYPTYSVFVGGRTGGKSYGITKALILQSLQEKLRILCCREFAANIEESIHQNIASHIREMGLESEFIIEKGSIRCKSTGSEFLFAGIKKDNVEAIKSIAGINITFVDEAEPIPEESWKVLIPTVIREKNSRIIISFNPKMRKSYTYQYWILKPPEGTVITKINYTDNPFVSEETLKLAESDRKFNPDTYSNIWLGNPIENLENAVYANELRLATINNRIRQVDYINTIPCDVFVDLGRSDYTSIIIAQVVAGEYRIIDFIETQGLIAIDHIPLLRAKPYIYRTLWLPHDAEHKTTTARLTIKEQMRDNSRGLFESVRIVPNIKILDGINAGRTVFANCYWDERRCELLLDHLRHYQWDDRKEKLAPKHDQHSHACLTGDTLVKTINGDVRIDQIQVGDLVWTPAGYSKVTAAGPVKYTNDLVEITQDNKRLICTPEHKIFTTNGLREADALRYIDYILSGNELSCRLIQSISKITNTGFRATITGEETGRRILRDTSIGKFGRIFMDLFRKITTSITSTVISSIMTSVTSNASSEPYITPSTLRNSSPKASSNHPLPMPTQEPLSGTDQRKVESGIEPMGNALGRTGNGTNAPVRTPSVAASLCRLILRRLNFATSTAKCRHLESDVDYHQVYDLTVEKHHCYQANGFLVSNCDAYRYMSVAMKPPEEETDPCSNPSGFSGRFLHTKSTTGWMR